jgi:ElaB/YqjD/DUF883 family membrane-anchored ribosome-binding protein
MTTHEESRKDQAADMVGTAKDAAQEQVEVVAEKGRGVVRSQVDERSTQAGQQAHTLAQTLRQSASQMRSSGDDQQARYAGMADQGADRLERVGTYLTGADSDELLGKAEDLARQQPWLIAGAGVLVGIAMARFLKASSSERYYRRSANGEYPRQTPTWDWAEEPAPAVRPAPVAREGQWR